MYLAVPMRVARVAGRLVCRAAKGMNGDVRLTLPEDQDAGIGDFLVHAGYTRQKISEADARRTGDLFHEITTVLAHAGA